MPATDPPSPPLTNRTTHRKPPTRPSPPPCLVPLSARWCRYEEAFEQIKACTGITDIEELVKTFIANEDQNFSLFNYVNGQTHDLEKMDDAIQDLKDEVRLRARLLSSRPPARARASPGARHARWPALLSSHPGPHPLRTATGAQILARRGRGRQPGAAERFAGEAGADVAVGGEV